MEYPLQRPEDQQLFLEAKSYVATESIKRLSGSVIHFDALYVSFYLTSLLSDNQQAPYDAFTDLANQYFAALLDNSVGEATLWFSGNVSYSDLPERMNFAEHRIKEASPKLVVLPPLLLFVWAKRRNRDNRLSVKVAGEDKVDAIAWEIASSASHGPFFIVSDSPRYFKYNFNDRHVYLTFGGDSSDVKNPIPKNGVKVISVPRCHRLVKPEDRVHAHKPKFSDELSTSYCLAAHEFINLYSQTGILVSFLPILYESSFWPAWDVGRMYRSYAYSCLIEKFYETHPDRKKKTDEVLSHTTVTEYYTIGRTYQPHSVDIFLNKRKPGTEGYLDYAQRYSQTLSTPAGVISDVVAEIKNIVGPPAIDDNLATTINKYLHMLFQGKLPTQAKEWDPDSPSKLAGSENPSQVSSDLSRVHSQLEAAVYSLSYLDSACPGLVAKEVIGGTLWRMSLSAFERVHKEIVDSHD